MTDLPCGEVALQIDNEGTSFYTCKLLYPHPGVKHIGRCELTGRVREWSYDPPPAESHIPYDEAREDFPL